MVLVILLVLPTTGLTATILLPSAEDTTISLCTLEAGLTSLWPTALTGSWQLTLGTSRTLAVAGAAVRLGTMVLGLAVRVRAADSLISAMATVSGSDLTGERLGEGERDSEPHRRVLGEVEPLAEPEDRGESGLGESESGLPEPLVLLRGAGLL